MSPLLESLDVEIARLAARLERLRAIRAELALEEAPDPPRPGRKPKPVKAKPLAKRGGEQRRPPSGGNLGKTASRVAEYFARHPKTGNAECASALGLQLSTVGYHLAKLRKAAR